MTVPFGFADVAVTPTAKEFAGIYRNKRHHDSDFDLVLDRAVASGVQKILLTCMKRDDIDFLLEICHKRPDLCSMTIGIHPYHAAEPWEEVEDEDPSSPYLSALSTRITALLAEQNSPIAAFGELGLDYDRTQHASKDVQIRTFTAQLDLLVQQKWNLPLFLHCRSAFSDFVKILKPYISHFPRRGLVHSFVGTASEMQELVTLGLDISVNGFSFSTPASLAMVAAIPLSHLQLETDAPWGYISPNADLAKKFPSPIVPPAASKKREKFERGCMVKERNESCAIGQVASIVAGVQGVEIEEVVEAAWRNSNEMFWPNG